MLNLLNFRNGVNTLLKVGYSTKKNSVDFLYGSSTVIPAITFKKRKLIRLHLAESPDERVKRKINTFNKENYELMNKKREQLKIMAKKAGLPLKFTSFQNLSLLSANRPHQGVILECGPLKLERIKYLSISDNEDTKILKYQVNYTENEFKDFNYNGEYRKKFPIFLALDQVIDPQNLGAILRTAYFFNIQGVILTESESAPLSSAVSKASSGALEAMSNLYVVNNLVKFLQLSKSEGFEVVGTDIGSKNNVYDLSEKKKDFNRPLILVMGNEGTGLRSIVSKVCDSHIVIGLDKDRINHVEEVVESLNVSVAAGIILNQLLS
ncbi:hypothetical protein HDU92_004099 [Lobulomyces angularis]|nr:hypothetical protein HDU92_004099 [Lobulomyces angularis]